MSKKEFVLSIVEQCKEEMQKRQIFASIKIAQAILESGWGTSRLATEANNLYGIKGTGPAGSITIKTREYDTEQGWRSIETKFKKYHHLQESIRDHTHFLLGKPRYKNVFESRTFQEAADALQRAGYATDPEYATKLKNIITSNEYDKIDYAVIAEDASPYARDAWKWALEKGITDGSNPKNTATREQVITMLHRFSKLDT